MSYYILETRTLRRESLAKWWRSNSSGYTSDLDLAGTYTKAEADRICGATGDRVAVPVEQARAKAVLVIDVGQALALQIAFTKKEGSNV